MKKLIKYNTSKSQTWKRQVLLRISNSSDPEEEMIVHLSNGREKAKCLRMGLLRCLLNVGTCTVQMQRNEPFSMSIALQNNKQPFGAVEITYQIFIACSFYRLL
jgi:hypothetical protein